MSDEAPLSTRSAARLLISEGERLIAAGRAILGIDSTAVMTAVKVKPPRRKRAIVRPPGESDELSAERARRILRANGFAPRTTP